VQVTGNRWIVKRSDDGDGLAGTVAGYTSGKKLTVPEFGAGLSC